MQRSCRICGEDNPRVLQEHHIVPRRYGGSDDEENRITLCANCHQAVESMYDDRFYDQIRDYFLERQTHKVLSQARKRAKDNIRLFIEECCRRDVSDSYVPKETLYEAYDMFCEFHGYPALSPRIFNQVLTRSHDLEAARPYIDEERVPAWADIELTNDALTMLDQATA